MVFTICLGIENAENFRFKVFEKLEMEICLKNKCTGCYACVNACSHHCIQMREDEDGAVRPVIDESKCVGCKLCVSSCPNNVELEFRRFRIFQRFSVCTKFDR